MSPEFPEFRSEDRWERSDFNNVAPLADAGFDRLV
jgi:hypothetical protein